MATTKKLAGQKKMNDRTSARGRKPDNKGFGDDGKLGRAHNRGDSPRGGTKRGRQKRG